MKIKINEVGYEIENINTIEPKALGFFKLTKYIVVEELRYFNCSYEKREGIMFFEKQKKQLF